MTASLAKKGLRIGVDARELLPDTFTGFGRYIENFLEAEAPRSSDHIFFIYGNQHTVFPTPSDNYTFTVIEERNTMWWDQIGIVKAMRKDQLDLFFTPYDKTPLMAACPVVMTIHDLLYQYVSDLSGLKKIVYNTLYRMQRGAMARKAARVLTVSEHSRQDISKYYGLAADQIVITYNAVSERFNPNIPTTEIDQVKNKYGFNGPYIFNLNNFKPHKNPAGLIEAYAKLDHKIKARVHLVIGGRHNDFTPALQDRVQQLNLTDFVHFPGAPADEDLPAIYAGADLFVISSIYEGFGIPPLEAMSCGTPVVSSDATSLPEVVGDAGLLVDPTDRQALASAMEKMLTDEQFAQDAVQKGLKRAKEFTQEKVASRILHALEETAGIAPNS